MEAFAKAAQENSGQVERAQKRDFCRSVVAAETRFARFGHCDPVPHQEIKVAQKGVLHVSAEHQVRPRRRRKDTQSRRRNDRRGGSKELTYDWVQRRDHTIQTRFSDQFVKLILTKG